MYRCWKAEAIHNSEDIDGHNVELECRFHINLPISHLAAGLSHQL